MNFARHDIDPRARRAGLWEPSRAQLRFRLHMSLVALDALCVFMGMFLAGVIYDPETARGQWLVMAGMLLPIYFVAAINADAYAAESIEKPSRGVARAIKALITTAATLVFIAFCIKASQSFSRVIFGLGVGLAVVALAVSRDIFLRKARRLLGGNPYAVALIADGLAPSRLNGFSLIIQADDKLNPDRRDPASYDRLAKTLRDADRVVVACASERRASWITFLKGLDIKSELLAPELDALAPLGLGEWEGGATVVVAEGPLNRFERLSKRMLDLTLSTVALLLLAPLMVLIAAIVKLTSSGPVFFVQPRIGLGNETFRMLKFRTMRENACDPHAARLTVLGDNRVTPIGSLLRRTSLDELPQLVNIILGDMSIVGPRPHALGARAADKLYWEVDSRYWYRHVAKPGLTGLAQIRGHRGNTVHEHDLTNRLQADLEYLADWSLWKDVKIIMMTFGVIIHKNAF